MNNSLTHGTPAKMLPDGHDRCHGEGCGKLLPESKLAYVADQPFCEACCACSECGEAIAGSRMASFTKSGALICEACLYYSSAVNDDKDPRTARMGQDQLHELESADERIVQGDRY